MTFRTELAGEHFELRKGLSYKGTNLVDESEVGLLTIDAFITGGGYKRGAEKPFEGDYKSEYIAEPGDVLLAMTEQQEGLLASPLKVPEDLGGKTELIYSLDVAKVISKTGKISPEFLFNFLRVPLNRRRASYGDTGTTVQRLPYDVIYEQQIPVPSLEEQDKINSFIATLDRKIELNTALASTLEKIAYSLFRSWFIDFDPVKAKMAGEKPVGMDDATAALFPGTLEESELGFVPKGWNARAIGEIAKLKGGKQITREYFRTNGEYPIFGGAGIMGYADVHNADGFVITLGRVGANCGQFFCHRGKAWVNNNATRVEQNVEIGGEWLFLTLKAFDIESIKKGAAQPFVANSDLAESKVLVPNEELMGAFTSIVRPLFLKSESLIAERSNLVMIRDALLPRLISGELQIPEEMLVP